MQMPPCWTEAMEDAEAFDALQAEHRRDGYVDQDEAQRERQFFVSRNYRSAAKTHECLTLAGVLMGRGLESPRFRRLMREAGWQPANVVPFPTRDEPEAA